MERLKALPCTTDLERFYYIYIYIYIYNKNKTIYSLDEVKMRENYQFMSDVWQSAETKASGSN